VTHFDPFDTSVTPKVFKFNGPAKDGRRHSIGAPPCFLTQHFYGQLYQKTCHFFSQTVNVACCTKNNCNLDWASADGPATESPTAAAEEKAALLAQSSAPQAATVDSIFALVAAAVLTAAFA
jgi:hypothetical protein